MHRTSHLSSPACPPPEPLSWSLVFSDPGFSSQRTVGVCRSIAQELQDLPIVPKVAVSCQHHWAGEPQSWTLPGIQCPQQQSHFNKSLLSGLLVQIPAVQITGSGTSEGLFYLSAPWVPSEQLHGIRVCVCKHVTRTWPVAPV